MNTVTVDKATWMRNGDGFWVSFRVREPKVGEEICRELSDGKVRELTIRRRKRSLDANAYAWVLMGKLAGKLRMTPEDVYRSYVPDVGDNYTIVLVLAEAVDDFREQWCRGHLGRSVTDLGPSRRHRNCHNILCYYGSSDYDKEQMARLIDLIVQDCREQGIETMTPDELARLVDRWGP